MSTTDWNCVFCCSDSWRQYDEKSPWNQRQQSSAYSSSSGDADAICGIGINFRIDKSGVLYVSSIVAGGPASKTGIVRVGDALYEIDDRLGASAINSSSAPGLQICCSLTFFRLGEQCISLP
eukprot:CAMPEP_0184308264 /NCGR_PEP_ID=MMETSP1049-20130417/16766_1 /TAXON_ID=77928 /ORGANISM="Proteomonas sulcata, Strain CCMP704" /LENGTH=121 /DNA_ID=CAMNT_0026620911 /DNA_START=295 /DNA_END=660 /DNA_ORIENTATION=+